MSVHHLLEGDERVVGSESVQDKSKNGSLLRSFSDMGTHQFGGIECG